METFSFFLLNKITLTPVVADMIIILKSKRLLAPNISPVATIDELLMLADELPELEPEFELLFGVSGVATDLVGSTLSVADSTVVSGDATVVSTCSVTVVTGTVVSIGASVVLLGVSLDPHPANRPISMQAVRSKLNNFFDMELSLLLFCAGGMMIPKAFWSVHAAGSRHFDQSVLGIAAQFRQFHYSTIQRCRNSDL